MSARELGCSEKGNKTHGRRPRAGRRGFQLSTDRLDVKEDAVDEVNNTVVAAHEKLVSEIVLAAVAGE